MKKFRNWWLRITKTNKKTELVVDTPVMVSDGMHWHLRYYAGERKLVWELGHKSTETTFGEPWKFMVPVKDFNFEDPNINFPTTSLR